MSQARTQTPLPLQDLTRQLVDHAPDAMLVISGSGKIIFANAACSDLLGYEPTDLLGQSPELLVPNELVDQHRSSRAAYQALPMRRGMGHINSLNAVKKDGTVIPVDIALNPIGHDENGPLIAVAIRDVTASRDFVRSLERLATTDALTGALNRRSLENAFTREAERCQRAKLHLFVMMLDIDHFKAVNDTYGHAAGDAALRHLVAVCMATLRKTDVLARVGGEEFAILASAATASEALQLAERLREKIAISPVIATSSTFNFTISIGVALASGNDDTMEKALTRADDALYEAKRSGRNKVVQSEA